MLPLGVVEREVFLEPKDGFGHRGRMLLVSLREAGCTINSLRPLSPDSCGPAYKIADPYGRGWDLWFKASGVWHYSEALSPYVEATLGLPGASRALGADLLLICTGAHALIVECKYSAFQEVVARDGYYQAMTYATEIRSRLATDVTSAA